MGLTNRGDTVGAVQLNLWHCFMWHFQSKRQEISQAGIGVRWVQNKEKITCRISVVHSKTVINCVLGYSGFSRIWYCSPQTMVKVLGLWDWKKWSWNRLQMHSGKDYNSKEIRTMTWKRRIQKSLKIHAGGNKPIRTNREWQNWHWNLVPSELWPENSQHSAVKKLQNPMQFA